MSLKVSRNFSEGQRGKKSQKKKKPPFRNPPPTPQYRASERNQMACVLTFTGHTCQGHDGYGILKKKGGKKEARMKRRFIPGLWSPELELVRVKLYSGTAL